MRRFFQIVGIVALILGAAVAGAVAMFAYSGSQLDSESKQFVDAVVRAISRNWDKQELLRRASSELLQNTDADQIDRNFRLFSSLGHLAAYVGSKGDSNLSVVLGSPSVISANYVAQGQNGD